MRRLVQFGLAPSARSFSARIGLAPKGQGGLRRPCCWLFFVVVGVFLRFVAGMDAGEDGRNHIYRGDRLAVFFVGRVCQPRLPRKRCRQRSRLDPVGARAAQDRDGKAKTGRGTSHPKGRRKISHADPQPVLHGAGEAAEEEWGMPVFALLGREGAEPSFPL